MELPQRCQDKFPRILQDLEAPPEMKEEKPKPAPEVRDRGSLSQDVRVYGGPPESQDAGVERFVWRALYRWIWGLGCLGIHLGIL